MSKFWNDHYCVQNTLFCCKLKIIASTRLFPDLLNIHILTVKLHIYIVCKHLYPRVRLLSPLWVFAAHCYTEMCQKGSYRGDPVLLWGNSHWTRKLQETSNTETQNVLLIQRQIIATHWRHKQVSQRGVLH